MQAYILIQAEVGRGREIARELRTIDGVVRVDHVTGPYDVIALVEATSVGNLGDLLIQELQQIPGITRTMTCNIFDVDRY